MDLDQYILSNENHIKKLNELVRNSIKDEELISSKILELESEKKPTFGQKIADKVASFGGSWSFIILFVVITIIWILINIGWMAFIQFDPFPFILLNLILSCVAALQAPVIMMSQNRQDEKDRRHAKADYLINLKSEMEIRGLHEKIDLLIAEEMKSLFEAQADQLKILNEIVTKLDSKKL